jgi:DNA-directed RNA polymerase subunit RPC12/RpoP
MEIKFACSKCNQRLSAEHTDVGQQVECPACKTILVVPPPPPGAAPAPSEAGTVFCPECGSHNTATNSTCAQCGFVLQSRPLPPPAAANDGLSTLIPYRNTLALIGYYLGVFSLIPCLGIPLGIAALILGILGLKRARLHPEAKGKAHAWTAIILGSLCTLGNLVGIVVMIVVAND